MFIERNVTIEVVDELHAYEASEASFAVAGLSRGVSHLPAYTEAEMRDVLGDELCDEIESAFRQS